jgi:hypothetical protein
MPTNIDTDKRIKKNITKDSDSGIRKTLNVRENQFGDGSIKLHHNKLKKS